MMLPTLYLSRPATLTPDTAVDNEAVLSRPGTDSDSITGGVAASNLVGMANVLDSITKLAVITVPESEGSAE